LDAYCFESTPWLGSNESVKKSGVGRFEGIRLSNPWSMASPDSTGLVSGQPSAGSELGDAIDREVSQARQGRAKIVANRDF